MGRPAGGFRRKLGLERGDEVEAELVDGTIVLRPTKGSAKAIEEGVSSARILRDWARDRGDGLAIVATGSRTAVAGSRSSPPEVKYPPREPVEAGSKTPTFLPDHRTCHRARRLAPNAGEEFACGNLRPGTEAGGEFPAGGGGRLVAQPIDRAVLARI